MTVATADDGRGDSHSAVQQDGWAHRAPFNKLPHDELHARVSLVSRQQTRHSHRVIDGDCTASSLDRSRVRWLGEVNVNLWPLVPIWPHLHNAAAVLDELLTRDATDEFVFSIVGDLRRTMVKRSARVVEVPPGSDEEVNERAARAVIAGFGTLPAATEFAADNCDVVGDLCSVLDRHVTNVLTMMDRFRVDEATLRESIPLGHAAGVSRVAARGDLHECGAVLEVNTTCGARFMYKPRSLALECRLAELFGWIGGLSSVPAPTVPPSIDRGAYGWQSFVTVDTDVVDKSLTSLGSLCAIAYVFGATDLHHENVAVVNGTPAVIDPECFFGVSLRADADGMDPFLGLRTETVLSSGLLPEFNTRPGVPPFDGSPLGQGRAENATYYHLALRRVGDTNRLVPVPADSRDSTTRPRAPGSLTRTSARAFVLGLNETLQALRQHSDECDERLSQLADVRVRHLVRPTNAYVSMIGDLGNCESLESEAHREHVTNMLWPGTSLGEVGQEIFLHERSTIHESIVPTFHRRAGEKTLRAGGTDTALGPLSIDGLALARRRLRTLSDSDITAQVSIAQMALALAIPSPPDTRPTPTGVARDDADMADDATMSSVVRQSMADLSHATIAHRGHTWWPVAHCVAPLKFTPRLAPHGLYEGPSGLALVTNLARAVDPDNVDGDLPADTLEAMRRDTDRLVEASPPHQLARAGNLGVFEGVWGAVYTAQVVGAVTDQPDLTSWGRHIAARTAGAIEHVELPDLISGLAGVLTIAAQLERTTGDALYRDITDRAFARLIALTSDQLARRTFEAGLAHGLSGQLLAFSHTRRIPRITEESNAAIDLLLEVEDTLRISTEPTYWRDSNATGSAPKAESWCRGAAGIAIGRKYVAASRPSIDADQALRSALAAIDHAPSSALCHGRAGIALSAARSIGGQDDALDRLEREVRHAYRSRRNTGQWPLGPGMTAGDHGLMCGHTGIALAALTATAMRGHTKVTIPDVLALEIAEGA